MNVNTLSTHTHIFFPAYATHLQIKWHNLAFVNYTILILFIYEIFPCIRCRFCYFISSLLPMFLSRAQSELLIGLLKWVCRCVFWCMWKLIYVFIETSRLTRVENHFIVCLLQAGRVKKKTCRMTETLGRFKRRRRFSTKRLSNLVHFHEKPSIFHIWHLSSNISGNCHCVLRHILTQSTKRNDPIVSFSLNRSFHFQKLTGNQ